jgi:hypothetical protein
MKSSCNVIRCHAQAGISKELSMYLVDISQVCVLRGACIICEPNPCIQASWVAPGAGPHPQREPHGGGSRSISTAILQTSYDLVPNHIYGDPAIDPAIDFKLIYTVASSDCMLVLCYLHRIFAGGSHNKMEMMRNTRVWHLVGRISVITTPWPSVKDSRKGREASTNRRGLIVPDIWTAALEGAWLLCFL